MQGLGHGDAALPRGRAPGDLGAGHRGHRAHACCPTARSRYLLDHETIDAVLLGAEWIAANGDTSNVIGSRAVAELAAPSARPSGPGRPSTSARPPPPSTRRWPDGAGHPDRAAPGPRTSRTSRTAGKAGAADAPSLPALDVIPAARITAFVTEVGVIAPPFGVTVPAAAAEREARRRPTPVTAGLPATDPSAQPDAEPSAQPSAQPGAEPSAQPGAEPSAEPSPRGRAGLPTSQCRSPSDGHRRSRRLARSRTGGPRHPRP